MRRIRATTRHARPATILLVDDEDAVQKLLTYPLERDGYRVVPARDGEEALASSARERVDLVVLDMMLPKLDGLEVCKRLRATSQVPIIMLTARDDELDKVSGSSSAPTTTSRSRSRSASSGAVCARCCAARADAASDADSETIAADGLGVDLGRRTVEVDGRRRPAHLRRVRDPARRWPRARAGSSRAQMLLEELWGDSDYREPRTIDVHVRHLREKLEADPREPKYIQTVRGVGYRFRER